MKGFIRKNTLFSRRRSSCGLHSIAALLLAGMLLISSGCSPVKQPDSGTPAPEPVSDAEQATSTENTENQTSVPRYTPHTAFSVGEEVSYPRLEIYIPSDGYCYISVDPELAYAIDAGLASGVTAELATVKDSFGFTETAPDVLCPHIAYEPERGSWQLLYQNSGGEFLLGKTLLDQKPAWELIHCVEAATGWKLETDGQLANPLEKFQDITEIGVYFGSECLYTTSEKEHLEAFEALMQTGVFPSYLPKTPQYYVEICCRLRDGGSISAVVDPEGDSWLSLWLPPCYYYSSHGGTEALFFALGLDGWPSPVMELYDGISIPEDILSQLYGRVGK